MLTPTDIERYFREARSISGDRQEANQAMSELTKELIDRGANRKSLSWARQLDRMVAADAAGVIEGLCDLLDGHPTFGAQADLVSRLRATTDQAPQPEQNGGGDEEDSGGDAFDPPAKKRGRPRKQPALAALQDDDLGLAASSDLVN